MPRSFRSTLHIVVISSLALATSSVAVAAETQVAVAANFTEPAREIGREFTKATGHRAMLSFGSSGAFYAQMTHGAPFEVFLSADSERPKKAEQDGIGVPGSRFTYAKGRLVLYSTDPALIDANASVLKRGNFAKLSIADPVAAPYGVAAVQVMTKLGVYSTIAPKIVKGTSITQAYDFVATGAAPLGFVALSQVVNLSGGSRWIVPTKLHAPIDQQAILLWTGAKNPAAKAFLSFLKTRTAVAIIRRYGYETR